MARRWVAERPPVEKIQTDLRVLGEHARRSPREPRLRELVIAVRLSGEKALVREVSVAMADGDRSVMTLEPLITTPKVGSAASAPS